jgi:hypothetical protein
LTEIDLDFVVLVVIKRNNHKKKIGSYT